MNHDEMDALASRLPGESLRIAGEHGRDVSTLWFKHRLHETQEVEHLLAWMGNSSFDHQRASDVAGMAAIELAMIVAIWPLPLDPALGRGG